MDIRTKLILALVSVSVASMTVLGVFAYQTSATLFKEVSVRQLEALAQSKKENLENIYESWKTQVILVGDRTQLITGMAKYLDGNATILEDLKLILKDAVVAARDVQEIELIDVQGKLLLTVSDNVEVTDSIRPKGDFPELNSSVEEVVCVGTDSLSGDNFLVKFLYALGPRENHLGWIRVTIKTGDLPSVTDNFTGLGKTGEVLAVTRGGKGQAVVLNSVRHQTEDLVWKMDEADLSADVKAALDGHEAIFTDNVRDYRGESVWSVTRYVPDLDWGLVVKVDVAEEKERGQVLRDALVDLAMALSAFAVVGGTILGIYLARPIQHLAGVVHKLREGNLNVKAEVTGDDEVAFLATSLNELIDDMRAEAGTKDSEDTHA